MAAGMQQRSVAPGRTFRVLLLQPDPEVDSPIRCNLREIPINRASSYPYEALSYVWGYTPGDTEIICDGKSVLVTRNCANALRRLRLMTRERSLWVDAVCVQQYSVSDKNQQVKLMGEIFRNAERVLVWLGEGNRETERLIRRLRFRGTIISCVQRDDAQAESGFRPFKKTMKDPMRQAFISLLENEWFRRAWTLQELSLAQHAVILCGNTGLDWRLFTLCVRYWAQSLSRHVWRAMYSIRTREMYQEWEQQNKEREEERLATSIRSSSSKSTSASRPTSKYILENDMLTNINGVMCIQLSRFRHAADPRDKVFAFHYMMTRMGVKLNDPDYNVSVPRLYEEVTFALIQSSRSLWILENVVSDTRMAHLPSWVPDFSQETSPSEILSEYEHYFDGYKPSMAHGRLILDGKVIHVVKEVAERMITPQTRSIMNISLEGAARCLARWGELALDPPGGLSFEGAMRNFCANLLHLDVDLEDEEAVAKRQRIMDAGFDGFCDILQRCYDYAQNYENGRAHMRKQRPDDVFYAYWRGSMAKTSKKLVDEMISGSLGHRVFVTSSGSFGLCKSDLQPDDMVVLFPGTTAPMILRGVGEDFHIVGRGSIADVPKTAWPYRRGDEDMETFTII